MTREQQLAYQDGFRDRECSRPMKESYTLTPHVANAYRNGYVDACTPAPPPVFGHQPERFGDDR